MEVRKRVRIPTKVDREAAGRLLKILGFVGLFLGSFLIFLFMTFPYEVLKETVAAELSQSTGFAIRIGELSARLPLGLRAENVKIERQGGGGGATIKSIDASVSILRALFGTLRTQIRVGAGSGFLEGSLDFGLFDVVGGQLMPRRVEVDAKAFPLDDFVTFALAAAANSPTANPMVAPLLSAVGLSAQLNAVVDLKIDAKNPVESTGSADISLQKAVLKLSHPSLGLPDQNFKKAVIKAKFEGGNLVFDPNSGIVSDELELQLNGRVLLKPQMALSQLDVNMILKLNKGLKDKFGFVIDAVVGSATSEGQLTMQLRGPMAQPAVTTL